MSKKITSFLLAALMLFGVITTNAVPAMAADGAQNYPLNSVVIKIEDAVTHSMLVGARFEIYYNNQAVSGGYGTLVATVDSDASGVIVISGLPGGYYIVRQTVPPNNYHLSIKNEQHCYIKPDGTSIEELVFSDYRYGGLAVILSDKDTGKPIANATFSVTDVSNKAVGNSADGVYMTDSKGEFYLENLPAGDYKITQLTAAQGYAADASPNSRTVRLQHTNADQSVFRAAFENSPLGSLLVRVKDSVSKEPLSGAKFGVKISGGADLGEFITGAEGTFLLPKIAKGSYIVTQIAAPAGYITASAKTQYVGYVDTFAVDFENAPKSGLFIVKLDADTKEPLKDAKFRVYRDDTLLGTYTTGADGSFTIPNLESGRYTVSELAPPQGYVLDDAPQSVQVTSEKLHKLTFEDKKLASLQIIKTDEYNGEPLSGAKFRITTQDGQFVADAVTDLTGRASVPNVSPGWYVVSETKAPAGYIISEAARTVEVKATVPTVVTVTNRAENSLEIVKMDFYTREPLSGASFKVEHADGKDAGTYNTDSAGKILVGSLKDGAYTVSEIKAPEGYQLDSTPQTVVIEGGKPHSVEFRDQPLSGIEIVKTGENGANPLIGAVFTVERVNGEHIGKYTTDVSGKIVIHGLSEGVYIVSEVQAPEGYLLGSAPQTVEVKSGRLTVVEFTNRELPSLYIRKVDRETGALVAGAEFLIEKDGVFVAAVVSNADSAIVIPRVQPGIYTITETKAPAGYALNGSVQTVEVRATGEAYYNSNALPGNLVTFGNEPLNSLEIIKLDSVTRGPLSGAMFDVTKANGEKIGSYRTDSAGKILIPEIVEGTYVISETAAPDGYVLSEAPKSVNVGGGKLVSVEFLNKPLAGLKIIKLDSETRNPIEGVEFAVSKTDGERVENDFRATTFKTDRTGQILIPRLEDGYYTVTETRAAGGYLLDGEPKTVLVRSGKTTLLEVFNTPMSGLLIVKTDEATGRPLAGVVFDVRRADGQFVTGQIADGNQPDTEANSPNKTTAPNGDITGSYTTDANGRIRINTLPAGEYHVIERKALDGYELDESVHAVTVTPGKLATLQITNRAKAGFRLLKIDSVTKRPIFGVEFMVFDANNKQVGTYVTDNNGVIDFDGILAEGRYTIRETRPADGYYRDDMPRTVEFKRGKITEIVWENTPQMGQIQITKLAGDDNEINGIEKGSPLAGAIFEVYNYKSGNLLDRFVSGTDGRAVSKPLPIGRYTVKEVQAPQYYRVSDEVMDIEIEFATQIIKREFLNYPANTGVKIRKTGAYEAMSGDTIRYDIKEVANTSSVQLTDFFWRDIIPTDGVRLSKIITGTYSQSLKYKIFATTNKGDRRVIADNLSTTENHTIDCRNTALGLANDEYVTSFTLVFGTVKAGFALVSQPQIYVTVNKNLPNGYEFGNKADAGGKYSGEWVIGNSTWVTKIYAQPVKLPRTGY